MLSYITCHYSDRPEELASDVESAKKIVINTGPLIAIIAGLGNLVAASLA